MLHVLCRAEPLHGLRRFFRGTDRLGPCRSGRHSRYAWPARAKHPADRRLCAGPSRLRADARARLRLPGLLRRGIRLKQEEQHSRGPQPTDGATAKLPYARGNNEEHAHNTEENTQNARTYPHHHAASTSKALSRHRQDGAPTVPPRRGQRPRVPLGDTLVSASGPRGSSSCCTSTPFRDYKRDLSRIVVRARVRRVIRIHTHGRLLGTRVQTESDKRVSARCARARGVSSGRRRRRASTSCLIPSVLPPRPLSLSRYVWTKKA